MTQEQKSEASAQTEQMQTGIEFSDLVLARNIIQVASQRGAFTDPKEFQEIGKLFQKLDTFVKAIEAQHSKETAKEDAEAPATEDTAE